MQLYRRGPIFWVKWSADGVVIRRSTHTTDRTKAKRFADSIAAAARAPTLEDAIEVLKLIYGERKGGLPLAAAWDEYQRLAKTLGKLDIGERTIARRKNILAKFALWAAQARPQAKTVQSITPPIAAAYAAVLAHSKRKTKTRANILGELGTIWRTLEKVSANIRNPWADLAPKNTDSERGKAFSNQQVNAILQAAREVGKEWYPVCVIALHTGLRYGDIARLKWSQIVAGAIRLKPHKTERFGIATALPLIKPVAAALAELPRTGAYCFPTHAHFYGNRGRVSREALAFSEVLAAAGVVGSGYTFHSFRHTAATRLADAGISTETRKRILGHTEDATADRYDHAAHLAEVKAAMEAAEK